MSQGQIHFWETVRALARATRTARKVELSAAADALELEKQAEQKLEELQPKVVPLVAAARRSPEVRDLQV